MSVRTDGWWVKWFGGGDRANNAAQQRAQMMMMAAENHERVERARQKKKHAEVQGYGVADLARLAARLDAWPMDGGRPRDEADWRALMARLRALEAAR